MSRVNIIHPDYTYYDIIIGWDVQLQSFFSYVERMEDEELLAEIGPFPKVGLDLALKLIETWIPGISTNIELIDILNEHKENDIGNLEITFVVRENG